MPLVDVVRKGLGVVLVGALATATMGAAKRPPADKNPPHITHLPPGTCPAIVDGAVPPCALEAVITDASGVFDPTLLVRLQGVQAFDRVPMRAVANKQDTWSAVVPPGLAAAGVVEYLIEAFDVQGNGPARAGDENAPLLLARATTTPTTSTTPQQISTPTPTPTPVPGPDSEDNSGLVIGVAVGIGAAVLVGAGVAIAVYAFRPAAPDELTLTVSAPAPIAGALEAR